MGIACSLMVSTVAFADFVDGGEWHYGVGWTGTYGYSNYHHPTRSHTATVKMGNMKTVNTKAQVFGQKHLLPKSHQLAWNISMVLICTEISFPQTMKLRENDYHAQKCLIVG